MTSLDSGLVVDSVTALGLVLLIVALFGTRTASRLCGTLGPLTVISLVPIAAPDRTGVGISYAVAALLGAVGAARNMPRVRVPLSLMLLFVDMGIQAIPRNSPDNILLNVFFLAMMLTCGAAASSLDSLDLNKLSSALGGLGTLYVIYAVLEEYASLPGIWPMRDASGVDTNTIANRPNSLVPFLPGRAMVSFGHPLPFSLFLAFIGILSLWKILQGVQMRRSAFFFFVVCLGLALAGSRSTCLAFVAAAVVLLLAMYRFRVGVIVPLVLVGAAAGIGSITNVFGGFSDELGTVSYAHRLSMLDQTDVLLSRPFGEVFMGGGLVAPQELFANGVIDGGGIAVFDNQVLSILAMYGLIGLVVVVWNGTYVLRRKEPVSISLLVLCFAMFFSFDTFQWPVGLVVFVAAVSVRPATLSPKRQLVQSEVIS